MFKRKNSFILLALVLIVFMVIVACGGGGGSSSTSSSLESGTVSGTALAGAPIVGKAYLKDANGKILGPVTLEDDGSFSFDVSGLTPPFMIQVSGTVGSEEYLLHTVASESGRANVNPLTELAVATAAGSTNTEDMFENNSFKNLNEDILESAVEKIKKMLEPILEVFNATDVDPLKDEIEADGSGIDAVFDVIDIETDNNQVEIKAESGDTLLVTELDNIDTVQIDDSAITMIQEIDSVIDSIKNSITSLLNNEFEEYIHDDFLYNGLYKSDLIDNKEDYLYEDVSGFRNFDLVYYDKDEEEALVYFQVLYNDGTYKNKFWLFKKDNGIWKLYGNRRLFAYSMRASSLWFDYDNGTELKVSGIRIWISIPPEKEFCGKTVKMIVVKGPFIENGINMIRKTWRLEEFKIPDIENYSAQTDFPMFDLSDDDIDNFPADNVYTLELYADYDNTSMTPLDKIDLSCYDGVDYRLDAHIEKPPLKSNKFDLSYFPVVENDVNFSNFTLPSEYTINFVRPEKYVTFWGYAGIWAKDINGDITYVDNDLILPLKDENSIKLGPIPALDVLNELELKVTTYDNYRRKFYYLKKYGQ